MENVEFIIIKNIEVLDRDSKWHKELNLVSWNNKEPKYDIRSWSDDHKQFSKGITLTEKELKKLLEVKI